MDLVSDWKRRVRRINQKYSRTQIEVLMGASSKYILLKNDIPIAFNISLADAELLNKQIKGTNSFSLVHQGEGL